MTKLKILGATAVWALPAMLGLGLGDTAQTAGPTEAPTGFRVESNGFAEEFCAQPGRAHQLAELAADPGRRVQLRRRGRGVHRPRDDGRRPRPDLQRERLR